MRGFPRITDQKMSTMVTSHTRHPWRSPVPYLFGGLAAMLGLITFALLLLACSYWTISRRRTSDGEKQTGPSQKAAARVLDEKILVIMAGENKPTFLATPVAAKTCVTIEDCEMVVDTVNKERLNKESTVAEGSSFVSADEEDQ